MVELKDRNNNVVAIYEAVTLKIAECIPPQKAILLDTKTYITFKLHNLIQKRGLPIDPYEGFSIEYKYSSEYIIRLIGCRFNQNSTNEGTTLYKETIDLSKYPKELKPVLAEIHSQGSLGLSKWYEVVYFDSDIRYCWCSYAGSDTFKKGEQVVAWEYVDNIELSNKVN